MRTANPIPSGGPLSQRHTVEVTAIRIIQMTKPKTSPLLASLRKLSSMELSVQPDKPLNEHSPLTGKSAEMLFEFMVRAKDEGPKFTGFRKPPLDD